MSSETSQSRPLRTAVIPAAGLGSRLRPATDAIPKELLPIVDTPVLRFVVDEAVASGIDRLVVVLRPGKESVRRYLDDALAARGAPVCQLICVDQPRPAGLGDAVRRCRAAVGDVPFAVMLGDCIVEPAAGAAPGLRQLVDVFEATAASVVAVERVPHAHVDRYGIADLGDGPAEPGTAVRVRGWVEKPTPAEAPSDCAVAGRYVFTPEVFDALDGTGAGRDGEVQLTDAMHALAGRATMYALPWRATRQDIGDPASYARWFVVHALRRGDTAPGVRAALDVAGSNEETACLDD